MKRSELFFSSLLIPLDFLALLAAFTLSYYLRGEYTLLSPENLSSLADRIKYDPTSVIELSYDHFLRYLGFILPAIIVIFALVGLYAIRSHLSWPKRLLRIIIGVSTGEAFILVLFLLKKDFFLPRSIVIYSWVLGIVFVFLSRLLVYLLQMYLHRFSIGSIQTGIIGKNTASKKILNQLRSHPDKSYTIALEVHKKKVEEIIVELEKQHLDELICVDEQYTTEDLIILRTYCLEHQIGFSFVPQILTELPSTFTVRSLAGFPMIEIRPTPLEGWGRVVKRISDIVLSLFFIGLFSPFLLAISLILTIVSPGPLLYKHERIGKDGLPILIWKFRSMKWEYCTGVGPNGDQAFKALLANNPALAAEWQQNHKLKHDPRITPFGDFLRKTSLDELPQFFNVLLGSLSLVGPRPIVHDEVQKYGEKAQILFTVKPGITGLWQVSGRSGTSYSARTDLDAYYIEHWNLLFDLFIIAKTAWVLILKRNNGAY